MVINKKNKFTLVELLAVMVIIAILFSIAIGLVGLINDKIRISKTESIVKQISTAMQAYRVDYGYYFVSTESIGVLKNLTTGADPVDPSNRFKFNFGGTTPPDTDFIKYFDYESLKGRGYIKTIPGAGGYSYIVDAWGRSLLYRTPNGNPPTNGTVNSSMFDLGSLGKDGKYGDNSTDPVNFGKGDDITNFNF